MMNVSGETSKSLKTMNQTKPSILISIFAIVISYGLLSWLKSQELNSYSVLALASTSSLENISNNKFGDLSKDPVFKSVLKNGAEIALVDKLPTTKGIDPSGIWDPNDATIYIKVHDDYSYENYLSILKHEAIHMAQSCFGPIGGLNSNAMPIGLEITAEGINDLHQYKLSSPEYYFSIIEREAHSNDSQNSEFIAELLHRHCGTKPWIKWLTKTRRSL